MSAATSTRWRSTWCASGVHHYQPLEHALVTLRRPEEVPDAAPARCWFCRGSRSDLLEVRRAGLAPPVVDAGTILANCWPWPPPTA